MTENIIIALISSFATLLAIYIKSLFKRKNEKKTMKETELFLENLSAKKATIIFKEDGAEFNFESDASISEFLNALDAKNK
ncbi:MAG TPA: hypothetical protein DEG69_20180 [Flavobacteriaceae bacterium]|nr:hypothetical protein [Flavobacteriaceae bacterium]